MNAAKRPHSLATVRRISGVHPALPVRNQAACVRSLLDEVERTLPAELADPISAQLVEELGRLGCRCVELAAELARLIDEQKRARCA
jgi:hypothetical protein